jgi:hypothetical protein
MLPAWELGVIGVLVVIVAVVSGVAGALWWRARMLPWIDVARLAGELAQRQRALEDWLARFEARGVERSSQGEAAPGSLIATQATNLVRIDRAEPAVSSGPTLIAVPDLASPPSEATTAVVAAELARRFGAIWALADSGASAEAIACGTGQPIGQVELVLGLRRQIATAASGGPRA